MREVYSALLGNQPTAWHHENEIITRSGERRLIHWNNSLLRSEAGEVIGTASIGEDITERNGAEVKIRRLNRVYAGAQPDQCSDCCAHETARACSPRRAGSRSRQARTGWHGLA